MDKSNIRLGIIGAGNIVNLRHVPAILRCNTFSIEWVYDISKSSAAVIKDKVPECKIITSFDELKRLSVDAVLIAVPVGVRKKYWDLALSKKWHVFCEKPLSTNIEELDYYIHQAQKNNLIITTGFNRRYYQSSNAVRKAIQKGMFSNLQGISISSCLTWTNLGLAGDVYFSDPEIAGGGVLMETGAHFFDQVGALLNLSNPCLEKYSEIRPQNYGEVSACGSASAIFQGRSIPLSFRFSIREELMNGFYFHFPFGYIFLDTVPDKSLKLLDNNFSVIGEINIYANGALTVDEACSIQWSEFFDMINNEQGNTLNFETSRFSSELIEQCYGWNGND